MGRLAAEHGFIRDTFEKVSRLVGLLAFFERDPALSKYLALKGGTAINLTIFSLPRLSVDIDLDSNNAHLLCPLCLVFRYFPIRLSNWSLLTGFTKKSSAPACSALTTESFVALPVRKIIGAVCPEALSLRASS